MKQNKNNRKKEALRANKHQLEDKGIDSAESIPTDLSKDLTTTVASTLACIAVAIALYYVLS